MQQERKGRVCFWQVAMAGALLAGLGAAAAPAAADPDVTQRIDALEQELAELKRQLATKNQADEAKAKVEEEKAKAEEEKAKHAPVVGAGSEGFYIKSADGENQLHIRGYTQFDFRAVAGKESDTNPSTFAFRRIRPVFEGTLLKYIDFKIMPDFAGGSATLFDAYTNLHYIDEAMLELGKFKPPTGLERLQSPRNLLFLERAFPTELVPNRDLGVQFWGILGEHTNVTSPAGGGLLTYQFGVFNGSPDNTSVNNGDTATSNSKEIVGRLFTQPFVGWAPEFLKGFGVGVAGTYGRQEQSLASLSFKTSAMDTFFTYNPAPAKGLPATVMGEGPQNRIMPQAYFYYGPFGFMTEYVVESDRLTRGPKNVFASNSAWQVATSWVLTGENASYDGVIPRSPLLLGGEGLGALEIAARFHEISFDRDLFPLFSNPNTSARRARAITVGLNWYMNRNLKVQFNYERTLFEGGAPNGGNMGSEDAFLTRFQLAF
ncbi:MAG TPA: porin [Myxococcota bacterium]|nr:porin [Myxococcota bacterium]